MKSWLATPLLRPWYKKPNFISILLLIKFSIVFRLAVRIPSLSRTDYKQKKINQNEKMLLQSLKLSTNPVTTASNYPAMASSWSPILSLTVHTPSAHCHIWDATWVNHGKELQISRSAFPMSDHKHSNHVSVLCNRMYARTVFGLRSQETCLA